jgi:succinoglycan biosynthesis transport protein ExoP
MEEENSTIVPAGHGGELHVAREIGPSFDHGEQLDPAGIGLHDILFILVRHKWKILFLAVTGLLFAIAFYLLAPPLYESEAKLLVRYVVEHSVVDGVDSQAKAATPENMTLINSEVEILTSSDLIREVAESVGFAKLGLGSSADMASAVELIQHGLEVSIVKESNIICVTFRSGDRNLPRPIIQELVKRYFDKHLEVHRSTGAFDFVAKETAQLKKELAETEAELKVLRESAGIISLTESKANLAAELGKTQEELDTADADLAAQQARVRDLEKSLALPQTNGSETAAQPVSNDILEKYKALIARLTQLQKAETDLLLKFTADSPMVKVKSAQIAELEKRRTALENAYPGLLNTAAATTVAGQTPQTNIAAERAVLAGIESKAEALKNRMKALQARAKTISEVAPRITELERKAEVEETNYKHSEASLEKARIDETLDPSRMPNISVVQTPSPAVRAKRNLGKAVVGIAGSGFAVGIAIALLIELILDKTIKRSLELEKQLRIPVLLSIPYLNPARSSLRLRDANARSEVELNGNARGLLLADENGALLKPFCEAIRDRLGIFFQENNMSYKPKLVAVTGLVQNAGTSTLAEGLAGALSEISEGQVLLVNKPVSPKGFYNMVAEFKRSDLDYVVFDLPSLAETSSALPLAAFMDTVLLVVEAEKSNRNAVKRAYAQLAARTKVSVVFNKSRSYGFKWLEAEF